MYVRMYDKRIIYGSGFTEEEFKSYRSIIYSNTIQSLVAILEAMSRLQISFRNTDRKVGEIFLV